MKILQLIDTLNPGGAEKMAINYWKALKSHTVSSLLVVTREKGIWGEEISGDPDVFFLKKRHTLDIKALWKLNSIIQTHQIEVVQAHGTSWFMAVLCKLIGRDFKLIWHDHYGNSEFLEKRSFNTLKFFSGYFDGVISVNNALRDWAREKLLFKKEVIFLPNFALVENDTKIEKLKGVANTKLICVANLRLQKDHFNLLKAFDILEKEFSVSLHLFGRDYGDTYSKILKEEFDKRKEVYYYGEVNSVMPYLKKADIAVISSKSEGLPLALIEYGIAGLTVVCTDVGECREVINGNAKLLQPCDPKALAKAVESYLMRPDEMKNDSKALQVAINELYSEDSVLNKYLSFIERIEKL